MMILPKVHDVREWFKELFECCDYVVDKSGAKMLEVVGATFEADEDAIFGEVNEEYAERELEWYRSMSLNVNDIPGGPPTIWKQVAAKDGTINSNYGYLIWSAENHHQYRHVLEELRRNPYSRRAEMIYTRPSMWKEYDVDGRSDFVCTDAVQYLVRGGKLDAVVRMRSNDVLFGYRNDRHWQRHVQTQLAKDLGIECGRMVWHAGSLHVYQRHFYAVDGYALTGAHDMTKGEVERMKRSSDDA